MMKILLGLFILSACASKKGPENYKSTVHHKMDELMPKFVGCYKSGSWFIPRAEFSQEMVLRFVVNNIGSTEKVTVEHGTSVPFPVQECIKKLVSSTTFGRPPEGSSVLVTAPLSISSQKM